ncbi:XrtA/PEP-CTERM system TPR-repeat protein PrsT [Zoogloea sp.]|uniref:XrtA/PEP-CTERM system TPR-repeat protein PrsT n=1 Tax=Zoogloea sp. TaxID=49181 RepID=UPI0031FBFA1F
MAALLAAAGATAAPAGDARARGFHQDAQERLRRNDLNGAIIQARNAVQQDPNFVAARILLGKVLLRDGQAAAAQAEFERALEAGASMVEVAQPYATSLMLFGDSEKLLARIKPDGLPPAARAEVLALRATAYADQGDIKAAFQAVEAGRAADPASLAPLRAELDVALRVRDGVRARKALELALRIAPRDAQLVHLLGAFRQGDGDPQGALALYAQALSLEPGLVDALIARASLLIDLKRPEEAMPDLERAVALAKRDPRAAYLKSLVYSSRGDVKASRAQLEDVASLIDSLPESFIVHQPPLLMLGGLASQSLGRLERARALLEHYVLRMPNDPAGRKLLAGIYLARGETARSADLLEPLLRLGDTDPQVLTTLAALRMQQRRFRDAAEALERAAKVTGGDPGITAQMGFVRLAGQQADQGLQALRTAFDREPGQPQVAMALATLYLRRDDSKNARQVADALVRRLPDDALAHNLLGVVKAATRQPVEARAAYARALKLQPGLLAARLNLARLDMAEGRLDVVRKDLSSLLAAQPRNVQVLAEMARLELASGRPEAARGLLEKARAAAPSDTAVGLALLETYQRLGQPGAALDLARQLAEQRPDDPFVLEALGRAYLAVGDGSGARGAFARLARMADRDAERLIMIGRLQLAAGAGNDAGASAEKALSVKPGHLPALVLQADAEVLAGNLPRAEALQRALAARTGQGADAFRIAGDIATARNDMPEADRQYRAGMARQPSTELLLRSFRASFLTGSGAKGVEQVEAWLRTHPDDGPALAALAEGRFRLGRLGAARTAYEALLAKEPRNAAAANNLAQVLMRLNDPGALAMAERAVRLSPGDAASLDTLGWLQVRGGALEAALKTLREARQRAPESRDIRFHLAWVLSRRGMKEEARAELAAALRGKGEFESERDARVLGEELGS